MPNLRCQINPLIAIILSPTIYAHKSLIADLWAEKAESIRTQSLAQRRPLSNPLMHPVAFNTFHLSKFLAAFQSFHTVQPIGNPVSRRQQILVEVKQYGCRNFSKCRLVVLFRNKASCYSLYVSV